MAFKENYNFENLVNEAERLVLDDLEQELASNNKVCKCEECILDMAAYALNSIKPYYRVSLMGTLYAHAIDNTDYAWEVKKAVKEAIRKIQDNPAHD